MARCSPSDARLLPWNQSTAYVARATGKSHAGPDGAVPPTLLRKLSYGGARNYLFDGSGAHSARQDGRGGAGEGGVPIEGDREMAEDVAGTPEDHGGAGISSPDRKGADWRTTKSGERRADF